MQWTIPNLMTVFRFLLVPVFVLIYFCISPIVALFIFGLACLTDVLDGYLARKLHQETTFGKWADPLADKIMTVAVLACLTIAGSLPWPFVAFYTVKELLIVIGGLVLYYGKHKQKKIYGSKWIGKMTMVATFAGIVLSFFATEFYNIHLPLHVWVMILAVIMGTASTVYYYINHYKGKAAS